ncbi:hypothetical protein O9G_004208 [Rozella allomycis CSF55]|uniref:FCH-domain-containing protein n=1 Tax=Rozella allomycis (strain CSF55) TaxID=988480 RepID=A0A075AY59_ROZAC|nr:hypothetical protein O9G_004208 [Rozella allomycis CSF55]|eukprot:EPZ35197.1 hypothetical protein O9G_004208 [Rozella allomycis CSF55]
MVVRFQEHFWGKEDKGIEVLLQRLHQGKHTSISIHNFFEQLITIEEEYSKKLYKLSKVLLSKEDTGTLKEAIEVVSRQVEMISNQHLTFSSKLKEEIEKPLMEFIVTQRDSKNQMKTSTSQLAMKSREKYVQRCEEKEALLATRPPNGSNQKDIDKFEAKVKKAIVNTEISDAEYFSNIQNCKVAFTKWTEDMKNACEVFEKMERERILKTKGFFMNYTALSNDMCNIIQKAIGRSQESIEKINQETDLTLFVQTNQTGKDVPTPLEYVNFYSGTSKFDQTESIHPANISTSQNSIATPSGYNSTDFDTRMQKMTESPSAPDLAQVENKINKFELNVSTPTVDPPFLKNDLNNLFSNDPIEWSMSNIPNTLMKGETDQEDRVVRAIFEYSKQDQEEIDLREGDILQVNSLEQDPWYQGKNERTNLRGLFPSNFVEKIE